MVSVLWVALLVTVVVPMGSVPVNFPSMDEYRKARQQLIESEHCLRVGAGVVLTEKEKILNQFIMKEKRALLDSSRLNRTGYIPAVSFFLSKSTIESTPIFKIIKEMPKGAALHLHDLAIASLDWVVSNATYRENVYMCMDKDNFVNLRVFRNPSGNTDCVWKLVKTERSNWGNNTDFDLWLKRNMSLLATDPLVTYPSVDKVWDRFNKYFLQVINLLNHAPIMRDYYRQALEEFRNDNVQYIELRSQMVPYYDLDGTTHDAEFGLKLYKEVTDEFLQAHSDFTGAKIIMSTLRSMAMENIVADVQTSVKLYQKYPGFFLGFDLVGQEDPNHTLLDFIDVLLGPYRQNPPVPLPYYFHAAETKWQGTSADYNLVDALLLSTKRIGHGFGLAKHPKLIELVKSRNVAVEVNPLSNQLLGLVQDLRNHAAVPLLAQNVPVVISSDDPATWEALPMSHDMYMAFMNLVGEDAGLDVLKQLVWNSIEHSSLNATEKPVAYNLLQRKWDKFISESIITWNLSNDKVVETPVRQCASPPTPRGNNAPVESHNIVAVVISLYALFIYSRVAF